MTAQDIARMSPKERLDLIGELWNSLEPGDVALTPAQETELARRMARFEADSQTAVSFTDIEAELDRTAR
jgi:putative addiction module component (TIGR02574 family)